MAILSIAFGKSMIFTFFAMAKEETPSSKTCMISISPLKSTKDDQTSQAIVVDESHTVQQKKDAQHNSPYLVQLKFKHNSNLKIALSVKIQHPANNTLMLDPASNHRPAQARNMSIGEHRHCCVTLGKKTIVSVISGRFMGFYVNGFL